MADSKFSVIIPCFCSEFFHHPWPPWRKYRPNAMQQFDVPVYRCSDHTQLLRSHLASKGDMVDGGTIVLELPLHGQTDRSPLGSAAVAKIFEVR